jgi:hypothetical protein
MALKIPECYSDIMRYDDDKRLILSVCDMSSFSLQVFLYTALDLKPTQDHPEMMGCDWLMQSSYDIERCKFLRDSIFYISECINESKTLKHESGEYYVVFDSETLILMIHEVEMALHKYMKEGSVKLFSRLDKNMLLAKPYMERLNAMLLFLNECIKTHSHFSIEMNSHFDLALAEKVFPNEEP